MAALPQDVKPFFIKVFTNSFVRRTFRSLLSLLGLSLLIFTLARVLPGDPVRVAFGPDAPEEVVQRYREILNLDKPLYQQYFFWLNDVINLRLGRSLVTFRDVSADIADFLPATLELLIASAMFRMLVAFPLGILSGKKPGAIMDNIIRVIAYFGICLPTFVWAIVLQLVFSYWLGVLPTAGRISEEFRGLPRITGLMTLDSLLAGNLPAFLDAVKHLVIPTVALSIGGAVQEARILRSSILETISKDYVLLLKSHGVPERVTYFKYVLRHSSVALIPVMGLDIASASANAFLVEMVYNWPGMSRYGMVAMLRKDLNAIVGVVLVVGLIYIIINTITDIVLYLVDPRARTRRGD